MRLAWLPLPLLVLLIAGLYVSGWGKDPGYESTPVFLALTLTFGLFISLVMAILLGRSFLIHRAPELLLIAMGAVFWGTAGFGGAAAGALQGQPGYANTVATVYNVGVWMSALCHLIGATLPKRWRSPLPNPGYFLTSAYTFALAMMVGLTLATWAGWLPIFFIPGEGGTLTRELVLYSAIAMLIVTGILFTGEAPQKGNAFKYLYGHALLLLAIGVVGLLIGGPGTPLAWAGRVAHALGSTYMLVGVFQAGRLQRSRGLLADRPSDEGRLGIAVAVAVVVAAAAIRVVLFPTMGDRFLFTIFYPALAFAGLYAGLRAGVVATVLGAMIVNYFWIEPYGELWAKDTSDQLGIAVFLTTGVAVSWMADRMRVAEAQARNAEAAVAEQRDRLEDMVRTRTISLESEIAERVKTESALRAKEAELKEAQRVAQLGSWFWDASTDQISASEEMLAIFGRNKIPPPGEQLGSLYPPDSWSRLESAYKETIRTGLGYDLELQAWRGNREAIWVEARAEVVRNAEGDLLGLRGTVQDITKRKRAEEEILRLNNELERRVAVRTAELQRANEALLHSNTELQHFAHATAHDLQTPLRSIAGFSQLVQRAVHGKVDEQVDEWSSLVIENTKRLQALIQEVLTYSRLDARGMPFEAVDLNKLLKEILDSLAILIQETGAKIDSDSLPTILADRTQIAQVLQNLIENAIKYNRSGSPRVSISCERQDDTWVFSVADNGIGIDPKHHERIFEIFRRLHSYSQIPGTGIGLSLCRRIVERHGGHIWVKSDPGNGSTFYFTLAATPGTSV